MNSPNLPLASMGRVLYPNYILTRNTPGFAMMLPVRLGYSNEALFFNYLFIYYQLARHRTPVRSIPGWHVEPPARDV